MTKGNRRLVLVLHNVRSAHNVGSLLRTADGLGVSEVCLTGYTPYPKMPNDQRLPHEAKRVAAAIAKTALGAEKTIRWRHTKDLQDCLNNLVRRGFLIAALEQTDAALELADFHSEHDLALVVGNEVDGLDEPTLGQITIHLKIPMLGSKESFNVSIAAAMALYHLRYLDKNPA